MFVLICEHVFVVLVLILGVCLSKMRQSLKNILKMKTHPDAKAYSKNENTFWIWNHTSRMKTHFENENESTFWKCSNYICILLFSNLLFRPVDSIWRRIFWFFTKRVAVMFTQDLGFLPPHLYLFLRYNNTTGSKPRSDVSISCGLFYWSDTSFAFRNVWFICTIDSFEMSL